MLEKTCRKKRHERKKKERLQRKASSRRAHARTNHSIECIHTHGQKEAPSSQDSVHFVLRLQKIFEETLLINALQHERNRVLSGGRLCKKKVADAVLDTRVSEFSFSKESGRLFPNSLPERKSENPCPTSEVARVALANRPRKVRRRERGCKKKKLTQREQGAPRPQG